MTDEIYSEVERLIVITVRQTLLDDPYSGSDTIHTRLEAVGVFLQPFDLGVVLSRHPALFRINYKGVWRLA